MSIGHFILAFVMVMTIGVSIVWAGHNGYIPAQPVQSDSVHLAKDKWIECETMRYGIKFVPSDDALASNAKARLMAEFAWELEHGSCAAH